MSTEISGTCDERFIRFKDAFRANFDAGLELGSSLAVCHRGEMVVDLWAGSADREQTRPWQRDTIVQVYSLTKIPLIMSMLLLVDRALIELDQRVAHYWPAFAANGKSEVSVRDLLSHQGGVPGFDPPVPFEALHDWPGITAHLAASPHWFEGRKVLCYHPVSYGFLLGELIRRVDGRMPTQFFREEFAQPIGADFQMSLSDKADLARVAQIRMHTNPLPFAEGSVTARIWSSVGPGNGASWERRSAVSPANNGYGNGRSVARLCSIMAMGGELDGKRYLSREIVAQAAEEQAYAEDFGFGWLRMGLGFGLHSEQFPAPTPTCFHWGGYVGAWGVMDPESGLSLGYTCNGLIVEWDDGISLDPRLRRFKDVLGQLAAEL